MFQASQQHALYKDTPGVDEVLDAVADCVNRVETWLEAWVHISLVGSNLSCGWK